MPKTHRAFKGIILHNKPETNQQISFINYGERKLMQLLSIVLYLFLV